MQRVIYCPVNGDMKKAENLSLQTKLPITIGKSKSMNGITFDEENVQLLFIPTNNTCYFEETVNLNFIQCIYYTNDWVTFSKDDYCIMINNSTNQDKVSPIVCEEHHLRFLYRPQFIGKYTFKIYSKDVCVLEKSFQVT
jgi:hypothetical protein